MFRAKRRHCTKSTPPPTIQLRIILLKRKSSYREPQDVNGRGGERYGHPRRYLRYAPLRANIAGRNVPSPPNENPLLRTRARYVVNIIQWILDGFRIQYENESSADIMMF